MENTGIPLGTSQKITVLLVDDHTIVRQGIRSLLSLESDIQVVGEAENGQMAIQQVSWRRPHVVIMDIEMPILNGLEATRQIMKRLPNTKVVILSGHLDDRFAAKALEYGVYGYLIKHAAADELPRCIKAVAEGNAYFSPTVAKRLRNNFPIKKQEGKPDEVKPVKLTEREAEILQLISEGWSNKQISRQLCITIKTIEKHRGSLMKKLDIHDIANLTRYYLRKEVISKILL